MNSFNELNDKIHSLEKNTLKEGSIAGISLITAVYLIIKGYQKAELNLSAGVIFGIISIVVGSVGLIYGSKFLDTYQELTKEYNYRNSLERKLKKQ